MAKPAEDVIELGSSDEESQPAQKKAPSMGQKPNAMVHIPPGVSIKSTKSSTINPIKKLIGKGVTVTKVKSKMPVGKTVPGKPNLTVKPISNGKGQIKQLPPMFFNPTTTNIRTTTNIPVRSSQPLNIRPNKPGNIPIKIPAPLQNFNVKHTLTINPAVVGAKKNVNPNKNSLKRQMTCTETNVSKKKKVTPLREVMTVNLDDDDAVAAPVGPQWYIRPEETQQNEYATTNITPVEKTTETTSTAIEQKNNSEPSKFIEITIEDSPIKPAKNKRAHEVGAEFAIMIDDSPVKGTPKKKKSCNTDNDSDQHESTAKNSKKKLNYPEKASESTTIEIEIEPILSDPMNIDEDSQDKNAGPKISEPSKKLEVIVPDNVIEVMESPAKTEETPRTEITHSTPKKDNNQTEAKVKPILILSETKEPGEFGATYQEFIDLCLSLEDSDDMRTIVEKKIKNYYRQVPKEYTESEEFKELVQSKILAMKAGPEKLYLYIKDVVDELNLQRKMAKAKPTEKDIRSLEAEKFQYGEESEFDSKRQRQIRKLEKTLKKLHRAIQKLEEQEVDFDDEEDSVYLLTERYKERMVRVHAKFCQLTNTKMPSEPRIVIEPHPGKPAGPAKRLEKWVNKKVPIGTPLPFPDFHDVLRCVREANEEDKLGWNEADIMAEARDLFVRCGKKLQRRRQENEWRLAASRISLEVDPAENSDVLKKKLDSNRQLATKKEADVFNKFADKQSQLKLVAEEIGDKEAEESPVEEEDEDEVEFVAEENSILEDKERRKERLRRLIKEKLKKTNQKEDANKQNTDNVDGEKTKDESNEEIDKDDKVKSDGMDMVAKDNNDIAEKKDDDGNICKSLEQHAETEKLDSDVDELHLLQKLHSDEVNTSTAETTDSGSAIDISDTLSSSDNKKVNSDVISIENSSYSESESKEEKAKDNKMEIDETTDKNELEKNDSKTVKLDSNNRLSGEIECASTGIKINKTNNDEYNESVESILLGSSDDDDGSKDESPENIDGCVNLKDDAISIGETEIQNTGEDNVKCIMENEPDKITTNVKIIDGGSPVGSVVDSQEPKSIEIVPDDESKTIAVETDTNESICESNVEKSNIEITLEPEASKESKDAEVKVDSRVHIKTIFVETDTNESICESNLEKSNIEITLEPEASKESKGAEVKVDSRVHILNPDIVADSDSNQKSIVKDNQESESTSSDAAAKQDLETDKSNREMKNTVINKSLAETGQNSVDKDEQNSENKLDSNDKSKHSEDSARSLVDDEANNCDSNTVKNLQDMIEDLQSKITTSQAD